MSLVSPGTEAAKGSEGQRSDVRKNQRQKGRWSVREQEAPAMLSR